MIGIYNGVVDDVNNIKVSPMSRAYTFGDAVYEVIPYAYGFVQYDAHIERLLNSCKQLNIPIEQELIWQDISTLMAGQESISYGYVYYQVSKGIDDVRGHIWKSDSEPERFGYINETDLSPKEPKKIMLMEDIRWKRCDIKTTGLTGNILALETAINDYDCDDVLFLQNNFITECSASNIFFVEGNTVYTPKLGFNILKGITRNEIFGLCWDTSNNINIEEGNYTEADLLSSDAVFQTSSLSGVRKVSHVNNTQFDINNSIVDQIQQLYFKRELGLVI